MRPSRPNFGPLAPALWLAVIAFFLPDARAGPVAAGTTLTNTATGSYVDSATNPVTGQVLGAIIKAPFLDTPGRIETLYLATLTRRQ